MADESQTFAVDTQLRPSAAQTLIISINGSTICLHLTSPNEIFRFFRKYKFRHQVVKFAFPLLCALSRC